MEKRIKVQEWYQRYLIMDVKEIKYKINACKSQEKSSRRLIDPPRPDRLEHLNKLLHMQDNILNQTPKPLSKITQLGIVRCN
jgi:hypothetical protein